MLVAIHYGGIKSFVDFLVGVAGLHIKPPLVNIKENSNHSIWTADEEQRVLSKLHLSNVIQTLAERSRRAHLEYFPG